MCLHTVDSTTRNRKRKGVGWKVFNAQDNELYSEFYTNGGLQLYEAPIRIGVWLRSKDNGKEDYPLGFHIFKIRKDACEWCDQGQVVKKVHWRDFLAEGQLPSGKLVIVAKEMKILKISPRKKRSKI